VSETMTSMQRVLTALSHKEADRVPLFLLLSLYGARELQMSVKNYFSSHENIIRAQIAMLKKYGADCIYGFTYAAIEIEALGGEVIYVEEGPPNSGEPVIKKNGDIEKLEFPKVRETPCLLKALKAIEALKAFAGGETPIIGVVMSPFSAPVMQMGFEKYIELIYENRPLFDILMKKNSDFCVEWANAQLEAGASAICYFDPVSSPTIIDRGLFLETGFRVAKGAISKIKGAAAAHLASGRILPIIDDVAASGAAVIGASSLEDMKLVKEKCRGKISVLGNLNGIQMCGWDARRAETEVRKIIDSAACGGGLIISDNHGEIPWQVSEDVLLAISQAVREWGRYPQN